jgi:hypothetical protein
MPPAASFKKLGKFSYFFKLVDEQDSQEVPLDCNPSLIQADFLIFLCVHCALCG